VFEVTFWNGSMFNFGFVGAFSTNIFPSVRNGNMGAKLRVNWRYTPIQQPCGLDLAGT